MKDNEVKNQALRRMQMAKSMPAGGRGAPARQQTTQTSFSPDYQKSKYAQRDAGLTGSGSATQFSAPGFTGKAKKARIHSQRVQYDRERRGAADKLNEIGARGQNQRAVTGMQQRGQSQRQQAGFAQALQEQQNRFGQQNKLQQNRFAREGAGMKDSDWFAGNKNATDAFNTARESGLIGEGEDVMSYTKRTNKPLYDRLFGGGQAGGLGVAPDRSLGTGTVTMGNKRLSLNQQSAEDLAVTNRPDQITSRTLAQDLTPDQNIDMAGAKFHSSSFGEPSYPMPNQRTGTESAMGIVQPGGKSAVGRLYEQQAALPAEERARKEAARKAKVGRSLGIRPQ